MRLYWELARVGFLRYASYRSATLAGVFTNTVFGFMISAVQLALFAGHATVSGYDVAGALTYVWVSQGMLMTVYIFGGWNDIALRVRTGDIATDFHRPVDFQAYWLVQDLGRAAYHALFRGIPPVLIASLVFRLRLPASPLTWLGFTASLALAVCISFLMRFMVNLAAFWILDFRGVANIATFSWPFLAGLFGFPLAYLPDGVYRVVAALPFAAVGQAPLAVFQERPGAVTSVALQVVWVVVLLAAGRVVLRRARRRLVIQGG